MTAARVEASVGVLGQKKVSSNFREIFFNLPAGLENGFKPGQFCMLSVPDPSKILRRPFSIYSLGKGRFSVLYKIAGQGTKLMSRLVKGDRISALLPLGNGFPVETFKGKTVYAVAGGVGFASVYPLTDLKETARCVFAAGFRTKHEIFPFARKPRTGFHIATEDGSKGGKGYVTDLALKLITADKASPDSAVVCACGPAGMLKDLVKKVGPTGLRIYTALEERMACGSGICMGCVVPTRDGFKRSCKDGPIFDAADVMWEKYG